MVTDGKGFRRFSNIFMILLAAICLIPIILLFVSSFTDEATLMQNGYSFFPKKFSLNAYNYIFMSSNAVFRAYGISFFVTALGTFLNLLLTTFLAYPLSRSCLKGKNVISFLIFFSMLFNGGLVPSYIMWTQMFHVKDTIWALIFPSLLMSPFNVIMMRNFFKVNIPEALIEAAMLDGASEQKILTKVVLPLSAPIIATLGLMCGLAYWNDWMNGLYYLIERTDLYNLQNVLNTMLNNVTFLQSQGNIQGSSILSGSIPSVGIRMAIAVIALVPVLIVYPFVQKGFVKGIVVGGVKG